MLIVFRKSDKKLLFNSGKSYVNPNGVSDINGKLAVIEQIGGSFEDYGTFRLHDIDDAAKVDEILEYQKHVNLVFDENDEAIDYEVDLEQYELEQLAIEEQQALDKLKPTEEEIRKAEIELVSTNLLVEVGLI